jgi:DNA polymerase V
MEMKIFPLSQKISQETLENRLPGTNSGEEQYQIDLNEQLIKNKKHSFLMRVHSNAMKDEGIQQGDVVIVDRTLPARSGKVIIAIVGGEMLIRRLEIVHGKRRLVPGTSRLAPIELDPDNYSVWGVVTYVIRTL